MKKNTVSRRSIFASLPLAYAAGGLLESGCQPPHGSERTSVAHILGNSSLRGVEAVIEKLPPVLPNQAPPDWQWLENRRATVGLLMISTAAPYLAGYRKAFDAEAKRLNLEVIALDAQNDPARQAAQAEDLIARRLDVLCFWPVDAKAIVPSVRKAFDAGLKLVCTNSWTEESVLDCFQSFVGASMVDEGAIAAQSMAEALKGKGRVVVIEGNPGQDATFWRTNAFELELKKIAPQIQILDRQTARWDRSRAIGVAENFLTTYPELDGILGQSDDMAIGAIQAIKDAGRTGKVKVVSIDASREGLDAIVAGDLYASCTQSPTFEGLYTARVARDVANGWPPPPRWLRNPVMRVDKSNARQVFGDW
jgi:ribose transport system substrate-binding protein